MPAVRPLPGVTLSLLCGLLLVADAAHAQPGEALPAPPRAPVPGYFGVLASDAPNDQGAMLRDVLPGSPAAAAGLEAGDTITQVGEIPIAGAGELIAALLPHGPGDRVTLAVHQSGFRRAVEVTLSERPQLEQRKFADFGRVAMPRSAAPVRVPARLDTLLEDRTPRDERLGLRTIAATQAALVRRGLPDRPGALVTHIERDSPADLAGIPISALIVAANGAAVASPQSLAAALASAHGDVELTYCIGSEERTCRVLVGE